MEGPLNLIGMSSEDKKKCSSLNFHQNKLEIFDPLGFNVQRWPNIPHHLLDFLHKFSLHRNIRISKEIQPLKSTLCGFYCVFFIFRLCVCSLAEFDACQKCGD